MIRLCLALLLLIVLAPIARANDERIWSDATGTSKVPAAFVEKIGSNVRLKKRDGSIITVAINRLSEPDRNFITHLVEESAMAARADPGDPSITERQNPTAVEDPAKISSDVASESVESTDTAVSSAAKASEPSQSKTPSVTPTPRMPTQASTIQKLVQRPETLWIAIALLGSGVLTGLMAWLRHYRPSIWFVLGMILPIVSLFMIIRKKPLYARDCETHRILFNKERKLPKRDAISFDVAYFPRLIARRAEFDVGIELLEKARERFSHSDRLIICHECAAKVGLRKKDRFLARVQCRMNELTECYPLLTDPEWEFADETAGSALVSVVQAGEPASQDMFDATITPNSYRLNGVQDRRGMQRSLVLAEIRYLQVAAGMMTRHQTMFSAEARDLKHRAAQTGGASGFRKAGVAVLFGAATGMPDLGAAAGGSLQGKSDIAAMLAKQATEMKCYAKQSTKSANRFARRRDDLRGYLQGTSLLIKTVQMWGVALPVLGILAIGTVLSGLTLGPTIYQFSSGRPAVPLMLILISIVFSALTIGVPFFATKRLREVKNVLRTYPDLQQPVGRENQTGTFHKEAGIHSGTTP